MAVAVGISLRGLWAWSLRVGAIWRLAISDQTISPPERHLHAAITAESIPENGPVPVEEVHDQVHRLQTSNHKTIDSTTVRTSKKASIKVRRSAASPLLLRAPAKRRTPLEHCR
jgi:hypothetical protein